MLMTNLTLLGIHVDPVVLFREPAGSDLRVWLGVVARRVNDVIEEARG